MLKAHPSRGTYQKIDHGNGIVTTKEELEFYDIVKNILSKYIDISKISYKDNKTTFNILYNQKITQWVCRMYYTSSTFYIEIPYDRCIERQCRIKKVFKVSSLEEVPSLEKELVDSLNRYINGSIKSTHIEEVSKEDGYYL